MQHASLTVQRPPNQPQAIKCTSVLLLSLLSPPGGVNQHLPTYCRKSLRSTVDIQSQKLIIGQSKGGGEQNLVKQPFKAGSGLSPLGQGPPPNNPLPNLPMTLG